MTQTEPTLRSSMLRSIQIFILILSGLSLSCSGGIRVERIAKRAKPRPVKSIAEELVGLWSFQHRDEPWCTVELQAKGDELSVIEITFEPEHSWTEFSIVSVELLDARTLLFITKFDDFDGGTEISLKVTDDGTLRGTVEGEGYDQPYDVSATRSEFIYFQF